MVTLLDNVLEARRRRDPSSVLRTERFTQATRLAPREHRATVTTYDKSKPGATARADTFLGHTRPVPRRPAESSR